MPLDSLFILSQLGQYHDQELIAFKTFRGASRKETISEFYTNFLKKFRGVNQEKEYPLIKIRGAFYAFITTSDILIGAILSEETAVLSVYSTLYHVLEVFKEAFKDQFVSEKLKQNYSSIQLMLDSFLDYGYPMITQKFVLQQIIKPAGVIEKIEEVIVGRNNVQKDNLHILEKYIDAQADIREHSSYRVPDIKGEEEVLFDLNEYLDCVIDKNGKAIFEEINGEIKMDCNLSGVPEILIFLNQPVAFSDYSAHECLLPRIDTYEREKVLNLIPPSGITTLFYYNIKGVQAKVPFEFRPKLTFTDKSAIVELKLTNRPVRGQSYLIEDITIKLITPQDLILGETEVQQGQLQQLENALLWRLGRLEIDHSTKLVLNLNLSLQNKNGNQLMNGNFIACLKFLVNQYSASQTRIEKVEVKNGAKMLTKKARNVVKSGYYEIRLN